MRRSTNIEISNIARPLAPAGIEVRRPLKHRRQPPPATWNEFFQSIDHNHPWPSAEPVSFVYLHIQRPHSIVAGICFRVYCLYSFDCSNLTASLQALKTVVDLMGNDIQRASVRYTFSTNPSECLKQSMGAIVDALASLCSMGHGMASGPSEEVS